MAKSKITNHDSARSRNELGMIKLAYTDHFSGRISIMCKLVTIVKAIQKNLTKR